MPPSWLRAAARDATAGVRRSLSPPALLRVLLFDRTGTASRALARVLLLNGVVYLGWGCLWFDHLLWPWVDAVLQSQVDPVFGPATAATWRRLLRSLASGLFFLPAYGVALAVSCAAYQRLADAACGAERGSLSDNGRRRKASSPAPPQAPASPPPPPLEGAAAALFRLVLYSVLTAEAALLGLVPRIGRFLLQVPFGAWAAAFFACDHRWERTGVPLERRLDRAERGWARLLGFGAAAATAAALLPLREGAAVLNCALAGMVAIACGEEEEDDCEGEKKEDERGKPPPLPLFALARAPAEAILRLVF